ncbi:MAG: tetratricopeptide repeat protein [Acidobacteria bacterium]|nr:tetratricopeptide repeat protein [Acidobacteriota bacterium]
MNKQSYLYGIIGLLAGLIVGYIGTNYINQTYGPPLTANDASASSSNLPPDHPPPGAAQGAAGSGPQTDVLAAIEQARNEPANVAAQMKAADLFKQINRHEGALEFYERAFKAEPNDIKILVALGDTNFDLRRYEEAEKWYQLALKQNPNDATVRMDLGLSFYLRSPRDPDKAIAAYRDALKIDPRHEKTLQNLTQALIDKGDKASAGETLRRLEEVNPGNPSIAQFRAQLPQ